MSQPEVTAVAQRQYDLLPAGWREPDEAAGWLLLGLVEGACSPLAELWQLAEDPGPRAFFDVDTVPAKWLPRLAERNGARLTGGMTEAQQRAEVNNPTGWRRTLPASILESALQYLPDGLVSGVDFLFRERTDPDTPGDQPAHVSLTLHEDDIADADEAAAILAAFEATIPIGMFGHLILTDQWWTEEAEAGHASWTAAAVAHPTWTDLSEGD